MNETYRFLKENTQVNYVSTINGDKPSCRPFGDPVLFNNKIYVLTNKQKNVSKQIEKNNNVCIVAYDGEVWIRINCKLIDDSNNIEAKQAIINEFPWTIETGYTLDNPDFQILFIKDADVIFSNSEGEILKEYSF